MARSLPRLFLLLMVYSMNVTPANAQHIFLDLNDDEACTASDVLAFNQIDTVDVWIDTSKNQDGSPTVCPTGEDLTIAAYELILRTSVGTTILSWTNSRPEFTIEEQKTLQTNAMWVAYSSPAAATNLAPGKYRLGRAGYQSTSGCPHIFTPPQDASFPAAETKFFSRCPGSQADYYIRLGSDFNDACGTSATCDGIRPTTWGHIKATYR